MDNLYIVLDVSSIIWSEEDYNSDTHEYYGLTESILSLFDKLEKENPKILISNELLKHMMNDFPYGKIKNYDYFDRQAMEFLSKIDVTEYANFAIPNIISCPNLVKSYFNTLIKNEVLYLISEMHSNDETKSVYFTFKYLWKENDDLKTIAADKTNTYKTIISDNKTDLDDFFAKYKLIFEHKSKHNCSKYQNRDAWNQSDDKGNFESQLSCYCDSDDNIVQEILDKRYSKCYGNKLYYGYDRDNNVYVAFRITVNNIYHAYDMYDIERVPQEVKKHFSIWRY